MTLLASGFFTHRNFVIIVKDDTLLFMQPHSEVDGL